MNSEEIVSVKDKEEREKEEILDEEKEEILDEEKYDRKKSKAEKKKAKQLRVAKAKSVERLENLSHQVAIMELKKIPKSERLDNLTKNEKSNFLYWKREKDRKSNDSAQVANANANAKKILRSVDSVKLDFEIALTVAISRAKSVCKDLLKLGYDVRMVPDSYCCRVMLNDGCSNNLELSISAVKMMDWREATTVLETLPMNIDRSLYKEFGYADVLLHDDIYDLVDHLEKLQIKYRCAMARRKLK